MPGAVAAAGSSRRCVSSLPSRYLESQEQPHHGLVIGGPSHRRRAHSPRQSNNPASPPNDDAELLRVSPAVIDNVDMRRRRLLVVRVAMSRRIKQSAVSGTFIALSRAGIARS